MSINALPIEDPGRISRFTAALKKLDWKPESYRAALDVVFKELSDLTQAEIEYYYSRRTSSRMRSRLVRFLAWALGSFGLLIPLVQPALGAAAPSAFLSWGYIAFGLAGSALIADTVFAGTQAHHR